MGISSRMAHSLMGKRDTDAGTIEQSPASLEGIGAGEVGSQCQSQFSRRSEDNGSDISVKLRALRVFRGGMLFWLRRRARCCAVSLLLNGHLRYEWSGTLAFYEFMSRKGRQMTKTIECDGE